MKTSNVVALLPMKAHSERIPGKNFKDLMGKPLFQWILEALLDLDEIDRVIINTDAIEILNKYDIIQQDRVELRERPEDIRGDFVSMNKVIEDDLKSSNADHFLMTHTTNPLISVGTIRGGIEKYKKSIQSGFDSLFSVNKFQSRFYDKDLKPINHNPEKLIRTQDLDPVYEENSCLYFFNKESFQQTKARIGLKPAKFITPFVESVDIDDFNSWEQVKINYQIINNQ